MTRLREGRLSSDTALVTLGLAVLGPQLSVADVCNSDFRMAQEFGLIASMHVSGPLLWPDGFERLVDPSPALLLDETRVATQRKSWVEEWLEVMSR